MAEFTKKSNPDEDAESERIQRSQREVREEMRIESLADDEELIGDDMFSKMHEDLASGGESSGGHRPLPPARPAAQAPPSGTTVTPIAEPSPTPDAAELNGELVLDVLAPEMRTGMERRQPAGARATEILRSPSDVAKLETEIQYATSRDEVARLALHLARRFTRCSALFVVNRGIINGLAAEGAGLSERIEGVMISSSTAGVFSDVCETRKTMRLVAPFEGVNSKVIGALGRRDAREVVVIPVKIRDRVVGLLYADNGNDPVPMTSIGALRSLAEFVGSAFGRMIMNNKH